MTSETDLSTADLAQPGRPRPSDRTDERERGQQPAEDRTDDRSYATSGNRVAGPGDEDTVELPGGVPSTGSTRDDARAAAPYPGRPDTDESGPVDSGMGDRDAGDRAPAGRGMGDRDVGDRGMGDRGMGDRGMGDRRMGDRDMADGGRADRDMGDRDMGDRDMADGGRADREPEGRGRAGTGDAALLDPADAEEMRRRWSDTQARFVDDPREAVQTADALVAELMQTLARGFSTHKGELEAHWHSGGEPDTEQLRQALQRYRSFFDRLLSA